MSVPFHDLHAVSITPFDERGEIDEDGLRRHLTRLVAAGVVPYLAGSGSGEANGLSPVERTRIFEIARDTLGPNAPLRYAAFEPRTLGDLFRAIEDVRPYRPDAVRLTVPDLGHGHVATATEAETFLRDALGELTALSVPVSLAIGSESVRSTPPAVLVEALLRDHANIVSLELGTADPSILLSYLGIAGTRPVLVPSAGHFLSGLALGVSGGFGPLMNLLPNTHRRLLTSFRKGDLRGVEDDYRTIVAVQGLLRPYGTVIPIKAALSAFGLPAGEPRRPRLALGAAETRAIVAGLIALGVPEAEGWQDTTGDIHEHRALAG
ncbi:dihydrodipicolinate synthase family protein [Mesorhizobium sp. CAU 1732]|uniref:dihydrodipicolinate synthase family protein n=1 Tax=Mesorhizobium sp. CAU 1732 TaxID=3140358 RepID=UPI0032603BF6